MAPRRAGLSRADKRCVKLDQTAKQRPHPLASAARHTLLLSSCLSRRPLRCPLLVARRSIELAPGLPGLLLLAPGLLVPGLLLLKQGLLLLVPRLLLKQGLLLLKPGLLLLAPGLLLLAPGLLLLAPGLLLLKPGLLLLKPGLLKPGLLMPGLLGLLMPGPLGLLLLKPGLPQRHQRRRFSTTGPRTCRPPAWTCATCRCK